MSRRGTQYLRRRRQYGRVADVGWAVTFAACATEADLDAARRVSHDRLIEMTGRHRRGGVMWTWKAATEAEAWLHELDRLEPLGGGLAKWQGHLDYLADKPDGFLVMARCRATPVKWPA